MTLSVTTFTPTNRPYNFVAGDSGTYSYEDVTLALSATAYAAGQVLGKLTRRQAAAPIPTIVGTGTGVMTGLTFGPDVQVGSYVITLTETASDAAFTVVAPDATSLPDGAVGTAYTSNHLSFSIADGGTMTVGDVFTVVVTAAGTPVLVGTGTGVVSGVSLGKFAQNGTYTVRLLATSATAEFEVVAPDGSRLRRGQVATAYTSDHVNFALSNGGTMTAGDYFNIIVANGTEQCKPWDPTAVDGTQEAIGVLVRDMDASAAATPATMLARNARVITTNLQYATTVTAAQKVEALRQLAARGIESAVLATAAG
jgi:hypothetical protein